MSDFTDTNNEEVVLCGASAYDRKYYFNKQFARLPEEIRKELQSICVLYTQDIGGIFLMVFDGEGRLQLQTRAASSDYDYDEIGAALMVRQIQKHRQELLTQLELFYRVVFLHMNLEDA